MGTQLVERENFLELAIQGLNNLRVSSNEQQFEIPLETFESTTLAEAAAAAASTSGNRGVSTDSQAQSSNYQAPSGETNSSTVSVTTEYLPWADLLLQEMSSATDIEDARQRVTRYLEAFSRSGIFVEMMAKEHTTLKESLRRSAQENHILKRGVAIQHARLLRHKEALKELQIVKQLLTQHQQQFRSLELENYALSWHLRRANEDRPISGQFHRDLF